MVTNDCDTQSQLREAAADVLLNIGPRLGPIELRLFWKGLERTYGKRVVKALPGALEEFKKEIRQKLRV